MTKKIIAIKTLFLRASMMLLMMLTTTTAGAWSGSGTSESPYLITSKSDLETLRNNVNSGTTYEDTYFVLTEDIEYTHTTAWNDATSTEENFTAIGSYDHPFKGYFDGQGHTISGIRIYKGDIADGSQGLLGRIFGAEVKNVILADARITGHTCTGGIVGYNTNGTVTNCHVLSDVTIHAVQPDVNEHGGIVGGNSGTISGCTSAAAITLTDFRFDCLWHGGITGGNGGTVENCLYLGTTLNGFASVGAIVGNNDGIVQNCYYTDPEITGKDKEHNALDDANSAVGSNGGTATNCGLARVLTLGQGVTLGNTPVAYGPLTAYGNFAISYNDGSATTLYSTTGASVALSTVGEAPTGYQYAYAASAGTITGNDTDGYTLTMPDEDVTISADITVIPWEGTGTEDYPYVISYPSQLDLLAERVNSGTTYEDTYFVLTEDLEYTHTTAWNDATSTEENFTAIGCDGHPFKGYFNGQGHTVSGIRIYKNGGTKADYYQGLFGCTISAEVKNVTLADARITGYKRTGGIVGQNYIGSAVINCHVLSNVTIHAVLNAQYHGGIVGENSNGGTVVGCTSAASITTTASGCNHFGGVVGWNSHGLVFDCLYLGNTIEGHQRVGAIVGYSDNNATVQNCYFTSTTITGKDDSAGTIANADCAVGSNADGGTVAAGTGVTIDAIALTGTATDYRDITGMTGDDIITTYIGSGGGLVYDGNLYYGNGCTVSLMLSTAGEAPAGYMFAGGYTASAGTLSGNDTDGYTLAMPDEDVTISATFAPAPAHFSVSGDEYTIKTAAGWGVFCDALQDNDTWNHFSGKTVKLGNDIGTALEPITRMAGSDGHDFCGTFDGDGHTLTVNISSDDITDGSTQNVAPFRYVSNVNSVAAAIRNLHVTGTITTAKQFAGGLIGGCWGNVSIENCAISTAITSNINGDGTHGGIVGIHSNGSLTITGCVFDGSLLGSTTYAVGGFLGWRKGTANIYNSLFAPEAVTVGNTSGATFARNNVDTYNSYYTTLLCDGTNYVPVLVDTNVSPNMWRNGIMRRTVTAGENVTIDAIAPVGDATATYSVSGITAYAKGITRGGTFYYGQGDDVSVTLSAGEAPLGYQYDGFAASAGTLTGTENPYTLTMSDADVTISANYGPLSDGTCGTGVYYWYDNTSKTLRIFGTGAMADFYEVPWNSYKENITSIGIEDGVTRIGNLAFINCEALTNVTIPSSVTSIGDYAFNECTSLTSVTIPSSVTSIGEDAFYGCTGLTSIEIPASVTSIGDTAFADCTALTSIEIPASVTSIIDNAFERCRGLASISVASGNTVYDSRNNCNALIETASNTLNQGCKNSVIPNDVTSIGNDAFRECTGLTSIEIPNSVTSIGKGAFSGCTSLTSVTIYAPSLTTYGSNAFYANASGRKIYVFSGCVDTYKAKAVRMDASADDIEAITLPANAGDNAGEYWTTYYNDMANVKVPEGAQAFKVTLSGTTLELTPISDGIISRGEAVVIKSTSASVLPKSSATASADDYSGNDLQGTMKAITNPGNAYVLNKTNTNGVGFYRLSSGGTIGAHKAYLTYSGSLVREFFGFDMDDADGIVSPLGETEEGAAIYNLAGQHIQKMQKGINIVNGKKIIK